MGGEQKAVSKGRKNLLTLLIAHCSLLIGYDMIKVTRLDGKEYHINPYQLECIEINPDTTLVMLSGKHYIIREEVDDVLGKIEAWRQRSSPYIVQE